MSLPQLPGGRLEAFASLVSFADLVLLYWAGQPTPGDWWDYDLTGVFALLPRRPWLWVISSMKPLFRPGARSTLGSFFLFRILVLALCGGLQPDILAQDRTGPDPAAAEAQFVRGQELLLQNDSVQALPLLRQAASGGWVPAQVMLAKTLLSRSQTEPDVRTEALRWSLFAGRQQTPAASSADARRLFVDQLSDGDPETYFSEARPWLLSLAEAGDPHFQFKAALWLFYGRGGERDFPGAYAWIRKAAAASEGVTEADPGISYFQGYLHENGFGTSQDYAAAARDYWSGASRGQIDAAFRLGVLLDHGQGVAEDRQTALELYSLTANQGLARAQFQLARAMVNDRGGATNESEALGWLVEASQRGSAAAQAQLGLVYQDGRLGAKSDTAQAIAWYRLAAARGHRGARIRAQNLEEQTPLEVKAEADRRYQALVRSNRVESLAGAHQLRTNLLPLKLRSNLVTKAADGKQARARPRTVLEARLLQTSGPPTEARDDLQAGKLRFYLESLQTAVRDTAIASLKEYAQTSAGKALNWPEPLELILSFRLMSDGKVEDVEVLQTNAHDVMAGAFVSALFRVSPLPRWLPSMRAEMTEDYQDLLMAFGPKSQLRIRQKLPE